MAEGAKVEHSNIKVVALADLFDDRLERARGELAKLGIDIARNRCFTGFDAYKQLLEVPEINYVILATPPHFRPTHLKAAIEAGKNAFIEKPAAVDVPGVHMVMEAGELAKKKNLGIAAGTQRRHQKSYIETIKRIKDGAIGDIVYAKAYWNGGQIWVVDKESPWSDMEWQIRNWNYFTWLSGDHIVEQHVHNLDVMNWVLGTHPDPRGLGPGRPPGAAGRAAGPHLRPLRRRVRVSRRHHASSASAARSTAATTSSARPSSGTKGTSNCSDRIETKGGSGRWRYRGANPQPVPPGAPGPDRQHPRRQADQRGPDRRRVDPDRDPRPRGRLQRPRHHLGRGHQVEDEAGPRRVQVRPLPDARPWPCRGSTSSRELQPVQGLNR